MIIPNRGLGGAQRAYHDHSVALQEFYDITEVIFNEDEPDLYPSGNPVRSLGVAGGGGLISKVRNFYQRVVRLRALKKELRCDVAVSHLEGADYVNLLSKGREKVVLLIQGSKTHDSNISGVMGFLRKKVLMPWLYKRADHIVTVSRDIIPEMVRDFGMSPQKLTVINNSFEVEQVWARSKEPLLPAMQAVFDAAPVLVTSGRLAIQKNQRPLLDIFATVLQKKPAKLVFIGDGELRAELVAHGRSLGLRVYEAWNNDALTTSYDVYFVGLQHNPFQYIRPATLFVFPSAWEGFPLALGEAMTCGATVLSTDCPTGPREMLAPRVLAPPTPLRTAEQAEYGVLLPMLTSLITQDADRQAWVAAIEKLLDDPAARHQLGAKARQRANDFTHTSTFARWHQLLSFMLAS